jgi:hypothetical protein
MRIYGLILNYITWVNPLDANTCGCIIHPHVKVSDPLYMTEVIYNPLSTHISDHIY